MRTLVAALLLFASPVGALAADAPRRDLDNRIDQFEARTGIDLKLSGWSGEHAATRKPKAKSKEISAVDPALVMKALPTLEGVLLTYPDELRGNLLRNMTLVGRIRARGKPFLGAAYPKSRSFDLAIRRRTSMKTLERTMHHEIAHIVQSGPFFPKELWMAFSEDQYVGRSPRQVWGKGKKAMGSVRRLGFISPYASKNRHEDFAEMAELAFTQPSSILAVGRKYPLVGDKLRLMTSVYHRMAPEMALPWVETNYKVALDRKKSTKVPG